MNSPAPLVPGFNGATRARVEHGNFGSDQYGSRLIGHRPVIVPRSVWACKKSRCHGGWSNSTMTADPV